MASRIQHINPNIEVRAMTNVVVASAERTIDAPADEAVARQLIESPGEPGQ